jgi:tripartite-type tricarboxylate transporter receptor subunit TctC
MRHSLAGWLATCIAALMLAHAGSPAAQSWPARPITIVVGFAAGGNVDGVARIFAPALSDALGQPVVVENRPGAGGNIGSAQVAKASPDGYTLLLMPKGHAASASLYKKLSYDSVNDFRVAGMLVNYPFIVVVPAGSPYPTLKALAEAARARPGGIDYGTGGIGTGMHLAAELMLAQLKISMQHVPYKGGNAAQTAMLSGEVPVFFTTPVGMVELHQAGKLRVIGVTTLERFPKLPDVPTVAETLAPGFNARGWMALAAPKGTPDAIIGRLNAAIRTAAARRDVQDRLILLGTVAENTLTPDAAQKFLADEVARWKVVVQAAGIPLQE